MRGIFEIINRIVKDRNIKHAEYRVFMDLVSYNSFRKIFPSLQTISEDTGIKSIPDISNMLQKLERFGYIKIIRRKHLSNIYEISGINKKGFQKLVKVNPVQHNAEIPQNINNSSFIEAWNNWKVFRTELKKPLNPSTIKAQLSFLADQPEPVKIIENSILNGWQGLFKIKNNNNYGNEQRNTIQEYAAREENIF